MKETTVKAGGAAEMEVGGKAAGKVAMTRPVFQSVMGDRVRGVQDSHRT